MRKRDWNCANWKRPRQQADVRYRVHGWLVVHGPAFSSDVALALGLSSQTVARACLSLRWDGLILTDPCARRPKRGWLYSAIGETPPPPPPPPPRRAPMAKPPEPPRLPEVFKSRRERQPKKDPTITTEDRTWQAFWSLPRAERRARIAAGEAPPCSM